MELFEVIKPEAKEVPILISFPHSGDFIPESLRSHYREEAISFIDDTDWYLPQLYDFASEMGITCIKANYSRWVIDLNRDPESAPLYNDGRLITGLCTQTDFLGNPIYQEGKAPDQQEVERRLETYYWPYYKAVQDILSGFVSSFGKGVLYDSHSIRSMVPTIRKERFPDMILGTADGASADADVIERALSVLNASPYETTYNFPFKGGHITRYFGKPEKGQHALQLERCKDLYMSNDERDFDPEKGTEMSQWLKKMFQAILTA